MSQKRYYVSNHWRRDHVLVSITGPVPDPPLKVYRTVVRWKFYPRRASLVGWLLTLWILRQVST